MIIQCDACKTKFRLDDSKVKGKGVKVKCTKCQSVFIVKPPESNEDLDEISLSMEGDATKEEKKEASADDTGISTEEGGTKTDNTGGGFDLGSDQDLDLGLEGEDGITDDLNFDQDAKEEETTDPENGASDEEASSEKKTESLPEEDVDFFGEVDKEDIPENGGFNFSFDEETKEDNPDTTLEETPNTPQFEEQEAEPEAEDPLAAWGDVDLKTGESAEEAFASAAEETDTNHVETDMAEDEEFTFTSEEPDTEKVKSEEDGFAFSPEVTDTKQAESGTLEEESFIPDESETPSEEALASVAKKGGRTKLIAAIGALVIVLAAFYLTGGLNKIESLFLSEEVPVSIKAMDIVGMKGYYLETPLIGSLFVIEGKIMSLDDKPWTVKGIKGVVFDKGGKPVYQKIVSPGKIITQRELKTITEVDLDQRFKDRSSMTIPAKGTAPFMVVFKKVSYDMGEYSVEVLK